MRGADQGAGAGLYTRLVSSLLFPLHERLKGHASVALRRDLELSQYWAPERLRQLQLERLRALLDRAGRQVPYYRELYARLDFQPRRDLHTLADLARLPLSDKAGMRQQGARLRAADAGPLARFSTGGSSGEPLTFYLGKQRVSADVAAKWRATRWWSVDIGDPEIVVWGSPIELGAQDRVRALRDAMLRTELLPAFDMSEAKLDGFIETIRLRRPRMLFGYPSALSHIARHAARRGQRLDQQGIRVAFVTSEMLYDDQRALIESAFGCPVANGYGGRDAGFIAHQCPHGGMHLSAEDIVVEVVDPAGRPLPFGESGEIVVTHLASGDYPFIRYRTSDIGVLDGAPCACGRGLPLLRQIQGRSTDFVVAADGSVLHGLALVYVLRELAQVHAFKIVQESLQLTRVLLVLERPLEARQADALQSAVRGGLQRRLGATVQIAIELCDHIAPEQSGKYRYVISKVAMAQPAGEAA